MNFENMDDKKWIENIDRFKFVSWLFAVILVFIGIKLASLVNSFVYIGTKLDPISTHFVTVAIVFWGYMQLMVRYGVTSGIG